MNYQEWNELIASYLFNEDKEGKEVFLYLNKNEIIQLYKGHCPEEKNEDGIWEDFIRALNHPSFTGYTQSLSKEGIFDRMLELYRLSRLRMNEGVFKYPPYILYLVTLVLPLTELAAEESVLAVKQSNYYDRAKVFFHKNGIFFKEDDFSTSNLKRICEDNKERGHYDLWEDLEKWSKGMQQHKMGNFSRRVIGKDVYVGILRAQSLITADELRKLPVLFLGAGLEEGEDYQAEDFFQALLKYGKGLVKDSTWQILRGRGNEEVKKLILNIVATNHIYWDGSLYHYDEQNRKQTTELYGEKKLKLQLVKIRNEVILNYRMFTKKGYPNDLEVGGQLVTDEKDGWSCPLDYGFDGNAFVKTDRSSKWRLKFEAKDIYLFGKNPELPFVPGRNCYIQQGELSRYEEMLLLVRNTSADTVREWGKTFEDGNFKELEELEGIPDGFSLYRFCYPQKGLEGFKELVLPVLKK